MSIETTYAVSGLTCGHCVSSVTEQVIKLDGVDDVRIELVKGGLSTVHVSSASALSREAVAAAVDEAGYVLSA